MLVSAAVCPHPPLLVPTVAAGAAPELDPLRAQCAEAVRAVARAEADVVFVVGADLGLRTSTLRAWGGDVTIDGSEPLPLPLLIGAWLTAGMPRSFVVVDDALDAAGCADLGHKLAERAARVGLVVMGDGSARHSEKAPGYLDPRAAAYDEKVARAFAAGDPQALADLDERVARELLVAGRAPWQVLAGAAAGRRWSAAATITVPYGVAYHVCTWVPAP